MKNNDSYLWSKNSNNFVYSMTWGNGYWGENYWKEEEFYLSKLSAKHIISIGCGLFRELNTLNKIATDLVIGIDKEATFIDFINKNIIQKKIEQHKKTKVLCTDIYDYNPEVEFDLILVLFNTISFFNEDALFSKLKKLNSNANIIVSVWSDRDEITDRRIKTYCHTENKTARIVEIPNRPKIIHVYNTDEELVFSSQIYTDQFLLQTFARNNLSVLDKFEGNYCKIYNLCFTS